MLQLLHPVQGTACAEPLDLSLVEGVVQEDGFLGPIRVLDDAFQRLQRKDACGWEVEGAPRNTVLTGHCEGLRHCTRQAIWALSARSGIMGLSWMEHVFLRAVSTTWLVVVSQEARDYPTPTASFLAP